MIFVQFPSGGDWCFLGTTEENSLGDFWWSESLNTWQAEILGGVFDAIIVCPD